MGFDDRPGDLERFGVGQYQQGRDLERLVVGGILF